jgi:putative transposase
LLVKYIEQVHADSRRTYGSPRVHAELTLGLGITVNRKRVERLMREAGVQGLYRRNRSWTTVRDLAADITEHPTEEGRIYCAAVMDAYSRLIIDWSIADHMRTELVTDSLGMAIMRRKPENDTTVLHFRPRLAIHVLGIRVTTPHRRSARFHGHRRRLLRQRETSLPARYSSG